MKLLDWYILKRLLSTFFFVVLLMALISCVIDYSQKAEDFITNKAPAAAILNYFINFSPYIVALLYPLFTFISVIFFTSRLAYKSEIIAILASGTSFIRFLRPYIIGGMLLSTLSLVANHWVIPKANKQRLAFEDRYVHHEIKVSDNNVHLRLSPEQFVFVERYDYVSNMGYQFRAEKIVHNQLKERITAERVSYDSTQKTWVLFNTYIRTMDSLSESLIYHNQYQRQFAFVPKDLTENNEIMMAMTTPKLNSIIQRERMRGRENLNYFLIDKHRRTAQPVACFVLVIIGACIASRKIRGGSGFHLVIGIAISALYMLLLQFSTTFSTKAGFSAFAAVWVPNVIFIGIAIYLLRKQIR